VLQAKFLLKNYKKTHKQYSWFRFQRHTVFMPIKTVLVNNIFFIIIQKNGMFLNQRITVFRNGFYMDFNLKLIPTLLF